MLSLISKLQRKPEHIRKKIALVASAVITSVIIIIWLISIGSSLKESASQALSNEAVYDHLRKDVGPFQAMTESFSGFFSDTAETLQTAVGAFSGLSKEAGTLLHNGTEAAVSR